MDEQSEKGKKPNTRRRAKPENPSSKSGSCGGRVQPPMRVNRRGSDRCEMKWIPPSMMAQLDRPGLLKDARGRQNRAPRCDHFRSDWSNSARSYLHVLKQYGNRQLA